MTTIQPPLPPPPPQTQAQAPVDGEAVNAQVVKLPESLAATDRALTLKGEVVAQNPDGTVRIATPRGPIDIKLPEGQTVQRGQTVEVQIPAGAPPRTVAVTLPQTPQDIPRMPQGLPLPEVATPQIQQPQTLSPEIIGAPRANQAQGQTAAPQNTQTGQQASPQTQQTETQKNPVAIQPKDQTVSPKGLLEFLKTSLQSALKTPDTPQATTAPQAASVFTQKPLAIGQLLRLTPLLSAQTVLPNSPETGAQPAAPMAKAGATVLLGSIGTPAKPQPLLSAPPLQVQATPLQATIQTILGKAVDIGITQSPEINPLARLLLPLTGISTTPAMGINTSPPLVVLMGNKAIMLAPAITGTPENLTSLTPLPHQKPVTLPTAQMSHPIIPSTDVRVAAILPTAPLAATQSPQIATLLHGTPTSPVMFATVAGQTQQGLPVLEIAGLTTLPDGAQKPVQNLMVLQFPARGLAPSTIIRLDVLAGAQPAATIPASLQAGPPATALPWASLEDAFGILHTEPQAQTAIPLLQTALPKPGGAAFTAPVLMFVAALRGGDVSQWLGEKTVDLLRATKRADTLGRIASDFAGQSRENAEAPRGEWKSLTLPMVYGQEITRIMLHSRSFERDDEANPKQKKSGTRFVMDISLTRMGNLQIDGLSMDRRLDATLRTEKPLSPAMRESVRARYANALEGIGFAGQLNFNASADRKGWVDFEAAPPRANGA